MVTRSLFFQCAPMAGLISWALVVMMILTLSRLPQGQTPKPETHERVVYVTSIRGCTCDAANLCLYVSLPRTAEPLVPWSHANAGPHPQTAEGVGAWRAPTIQCRPLSASNPRLPVG